MKRNESQPFAPIAAARLGQHPSHSRVAFQAAARVTAGWPSPEEFARGSDDLTFRPDLGMWVRGGRRDSEEAAAGRMDSSDGEVIRRRKRRGVPFAYALIHRDGEDPELVESGFRFDGAVTQSSRVADAAVSVLQAMRSIAASWDQMDAQTRASAQLAVGAGRRFLQAAGVRSVGA